MHHAMKRWGVALVLLAAAAAAPAAAQTFSYSVIDAKAPAKLWGKTSADMDGDGLIDLLVGSHASSKAGLYWYRNPDWTRTAISTTAIVGTDIEVADVDGNGVQDVAATTDTGGVSGVTLFQLGETGWTASAIVTGYKLHDLEVADLDGDGRLDLVGRGQNSAGNRLHIWLQETPGGWTYRRIGLPAENGDGLRIVDLDQDGQVDIVVPRHWLRNTSTPGVLTLTRLTYNSTAPANGIVVVGHVDGDAALDIAVAPAHRAGSFSRLSWFKGPEDPAAGAIWPEMLIEDFVEADHHFLGFGDFDRDGTMDIATAMTELTVNPKIKLFLNLAGDGTFAPPLIVADTSSHGMQILAVGTDDYLSLVGADYNRTVRTPIKLWRQVAQPANLDRGWGERVMLATLQGLQNSAAEGMAMLADFWEPEPVASPPDWDDGICRAGAAVPGPGLASAARGDPLPG